MKIAICFHGQLRFTNECSPEIHHNLIDLYESDVYAHIWWSEYMLGKPFHHEYDDLYKEKIEDFVALYNPKRIKVEERYIMDDLKEYVTHVREDENWAAYLDADHIKNIVYKINSQYYSRRQSYELIERPENYDFIVCVRTDSCMANPISLNFLQKDTLYVQDGNFTGFAPTYCDIFEVGNSSVMRLYSETWSSDPEKNEIRKYFREGVIHIHKFVEATIKNRGIKSELREFNVRAPTNIGRFFQLRKPPFQFNSRIWV